VSIITMELSNPGEVAVFVTKPPMPRYAAHYVDNRWPLRAEVALEYRGKAIDSFPFSIKAERALPLPEIELELPDSSCAGKPVAMEVTITNEGRFGEGTLTIEGKERSVSMDAGETRTLSRTFRMGTEDRTFDASIELDDQTDSASKTVEAIMPKSSVSLAGGDRWRKPGEDVGFDVETEQVNCPSKVKIDLLRTDTGEELDSTTFSSKAGETRTESLGFDMPTDKFSVRAKSFVKPVDEWIESDETRAVDVFPARTMFIDDAQGVDIYGGREATLPYSFQIVARGAKGENLERTDRLIGGLGIFSWTGIMEKRGLDSVSFSNLSSLALALEKEVFVVDNGRNVGWKTRYRKIRPPAPLPHEVIRRFFGVSYLPGS